MKRFCLIGIMLVIGTMAVAQNSTQGKEFWFSFMQNGYKENDGTWVETQVMISAKRACSGTIANPRTSWSMPFSVGNESVVVLSIPENQCYNENNEGIPSDFGLLLTATDTVSVFIANCATNSFDASFVLPVESLGSEYIIQCGPQSSSQSPWGGGFPDQETSAFLIVAIEDNTEVSINPSQITIDGHMAAVDYSVTLDRGQTYSTRTNPIVYQSLGNDFSGTRISARNGKKIAVFNGNTLTTIPYNAPSGHDHIFEQALSVETWGKHFAVTASSTRTRDLVKITASENGDDVWCNGVHLATLGKGESYTFWLYSSFSGNHTFGGGSCYIETSQPSIVYLYNATSQDPEAFEQENGDPSMVWIPPVEQKINEITFCTFNHQNATIDNHYVNIVVDSRSVNEVYLDGTLLNGVDFQPVIGNQDYSYIQVEISHGIHHLSCEWGLVAHVYGFGYVKGYAYCVGANVEDLTSVLFVNGLLSATYHNGLNLCVGDDADFEVRTNYPVQSVVWDFDGTQVSGDITASHTYNQAGDFITKAIVKGRDAYTNEFFYDTLTTEVHVGAAGYASLNYVVCDMDSFDFHGETFTESGYYELSVPNGYNCDSVFYLTLDLGFTPNFSVKGDHWPIGGSETYISVNEYAIQLENESTPVDTVIWQIDCENWRIVPHGKGKTCTLYIYSYLEEPVMMHATAVNSCGTITEDFAVKTTYFGTEETWDSGEFTISPNPSDGHLTLHLDGLSGMAEIGVYDSSGQRVETFVVDTDVAKVYDYNMPQGSNGLYFMVLRNKGQTAVRKVSVVQ